MNSKLNSLIRQSKIESLKSFQRQKDKTQVIASDSKQKDTVMNRLTHSYIVKTGAEIISSSILSSGINVDFKNSIGNVCLIHDIGHPPFGHTGANIIDKKFKSLGIEEGFSDNNNNFIVLNKNGGSRILTDYELSSVVKYPNKLYKSQDYLLNLLNLSIKEDVKFFEKEEVKIFEKPKRTIACEIMDEADRNAYVCSDLTDCYILEYENEISLEKFIDEHEYYNVEIKDALASIYSSVKNKEKNLIRFSFNKIFNLLNMNYYIGNNIKLEYRDNEINNFREDLYGLEKEIFINSKKAMDTKIIMENNLNSYIDYVINNNYYPSKTYKKLIENSKDEKSKLIFIRDMIGESTDWFVNKQVKDFNLI